MSLVNGLLNQTLTGIYSVARDRYGTPTQTLKESNVTCRWQEKIQRVVSVSGEVVVSKVECWLLPSVSVTESDRFVKNSVTYSVVAYSQHYNLSGSHDHTKVYLV